VLVRHPGGLPDDSGDVIIYPASGTGAWEAALANTLQPGDGVVIYETGHFATLWAQMARELGLDVTFLEGDWRRGVDAAAIGEVLAADTDIASGRARDAQRDVDRRHQRHPRRARRDGRRRIIRRC
jgi:D-arabinose 1-dehydrogenase-like Zn-dependent alcohol dehydrogenase